MPQDPVDKLIRTIKKDMSNIVRQAPRAVGRIAINFMEDNFEKGGFQNAPGSVDKWKPRKNDDDPGRGVLIGKQSGKLMKSGKVFKADPSAVIVGVPDNVAEYAKIHNKGGTVHPAVTDKMRRYAWFRYARTGEDKWKGLALTRKRRLTIRIPQRKFLGNSPELNRRIGAYYIKMFRQKLKGVIR